MSNLFCTVLQAQFFNFDEPKSDSCSKKAAGSTFNDPVFITPVVEEAFCELSNEGIKKEGPTSITL